jgi:hypothetical protein
MISFGGVLVGRNAGWQFGGQAEGRKGNNTPFPLSS